MINFILLDGHYLNLPVLDNGEIIGMVDVLRLTYATLEQVSLKLFFFFGYHGEQVNNKTFSIFS